MKVCAWESAWIEELHVPTLWRENPRWKSKCSKLFMTYGPVSCITSVSNTGNSGAFCAAPGFGGGPKLLLEDPGETGVFCMPYANVSLVHSLSELHNFLKKGIFIPSPLMDEDLPQHITAFHLQKRIIWKMPAVRPHTDKNSSALHWGEQVLPVPSLCPDRRTWVPWPCHTHIMPRLWDWDMGMISMGQPAPGFHPGVDLCVCSTVCSKIQGIRISLTPGCTCMLCHQESCPSSDAIKDSETVGLCSWLKIQSYGDDTLKDFLGSTESKREKDK